MKLSLLKMAAIGIVSAGIVLQAAQIPINGGFESRTDGNPAYYGWNMTPNGDTAKATYEVDSVSGTAKSGKAFYRINVTAVSSQNWHIQAKDPTWPAKKDCIYHMTLWARADSIRKAQISVYGNQNDPNTYRASTEIMLTKEWKRYHQVFISDAEGAGKINFAFVCGFEKGVFDIDSVSIEESPANGTLYANGGFEADGAGWSLYVNSDSAAAATMSIETTGAKEGVQFCRVNTTSASKNNSWQVQLQDGPLTVDSGTTYTITVWAKADSARSIEIVAQGGASSEYAYYAGETANLTTEWKEYTLSYMSLATGPDSLNFFFYCGGAVGKYDFDGVVLTKEVVIGVDRVKPAIVSRGQGLSVSLLPQSLRCIGAVSNGKAFDANIYNVQGRLFSSHTIMSSKVFDLPRPPSGTWIVKTPFSRSTVVVP